MHIVNIIYNTQSLDQLCWQQAYHSVNYVTVPHVYQLATAEVLQGVSFVYRPHCRCGCIIFVLEVLFGSLVYWKMHCLSSLGCVSIL
jgi:hypothetical protein